MLQDEKRRFKIQLLETIRSVLSQEVESVSEEMNKVLASAREEGKSSMGDKYETGRAMAHLELEKLSGQLDNKRSMLAYLQRINIEPLKATVQPGAVVESTFGTFFISVQAAEVVLNSKRIIPISLQSPLGKMLNGAVAGTIVNFNGREIAVQDIY